MSDWLMMCDLLIPGCGQPFLTNHCCLLMLSLVCVFITLSYQTQNSGSCSGGNSSLGRIKKQTPCVVEIHEYCIMAVIINARI